MWGSAHPVGKAIVAGVRDRETGVVSAAVVSDTKTEILQGFVVDNAALDAEVYHDDATAYRDLPFSFQPCFCAA